MFAAWGAKTDAHRHFWKTALFLTVACLAGSAAAQDYGIPPAAAAPAPPAGPAFLLSPYLGLQETYTDNATLTSTDHRSDFITRGLAGLNAQINQGRLALGLDAHYAYDWYARTSVLDGGSVFANGGGTYTILRDRLWIEADGTVTNGYTSSFGQSAVNRSGIDGRAQIAAYKIGPQFSSTLGDLADLQVAARFMQVFYSKADGTATTPTLPSNDNIYQLVGRVDTGDRHAGIQLLTTGQYQSDDNGFHTGNAVESAYIRLTPGVRGILRAGYERVYQTDSVDISAPLLSAGLEFTFNRDSTLSLEGGRRYDRTAWAADADIHFSPKISLTGYYREQIAPDQVFVAGSFAEFVAQTAVLPAPVVPASLTLEENVYNEVSYNKSAQLRLIFKDEVQELDATAWWSDRHFLKSDTHDRSATMSLSYSRRLRADIGATVDATYQRTYASPVYGQSENYGASASLFYWVNSTTSLRGSYNYRRGKQLFAGGQEISENALLVAVEKRF